MLVKAALMRATTHKVVTHRLIWEVVTKPYWTLLVSVLIISQGTLTQIR